ncbi:MAG: L-rhamnose/proton symporter RhaT, partial [Saprospiraceae bacterium]
ELGVLAEAAGVRPLFRNNLSLVVILLGGLVTNLTYCGLLFARNGTLSDLRKPAAPNRKNAVLSAAGGATWYFQFFFYGMGAVYLGERYDFASWTIHMAFIILFSNLWGLYLREWAGSSRRVIGWLAAGLAVLVGSTALIGLA